MTANLIKLNCYKVTFQPNLDQVAAFFEMPFTNPSHDYLLLQSEQIGSVLKYTVSQKWAWFFKYGCISFANFETDEIYRFLNHLESTFVKIDFHLFSTYYESYELEISDQAANIDNLLGLNAILLAKSTELKYLEDQLSSTIDQAEQLVVKLQRGSVKPDNRKTKEFTFRIVRLQLHLINTLKLLDRPSAYSDLTDRALYKSKVEYFEIRKRFDTVQTKINNLNTITTPYQILGFNHRENRLFLLEVVLIALFPLFRIMNYFLPKILTTFHFL